MEQLFQSRQKVAERSSRGQAWIPLLGLALGLTTGWLLIHFRIIPRLQRNSFPSVPLVKITSQAAPGARPETSIGPADAPVTLEEFSDFQCPPCGNLHGILKRVENDYAPRLKIIFRHYPLRQWHTNAFDAARAAEAAAAQGRFWEMHDRLFDEQRRWSKSDDARSIFLAYARAMHLDMDRFTRDMISPRVEARITADLERGDSIGVPGTPVVLVNGRQVSPERFSYVGIRGAIEKELRVASAMPNTKNSGRPATLCGSESSGQHGCAAQ
jgi:protein-disulfide isomerase